MRVPACTHIISQNVPCCIRKRHASTGLYIKAGREGQLQHSSLGNSIPEVLVQSHAIDVLIDFGHLALDCYCMSGTKLYRLWNYRGWWTMVLTEITTTDYRTNLCCWIDATASDGQQIGAGLTKTVAERYCCLDCVSTCDAGAGIFCSWLQHAWYRERNNTSLLLWQGLKEEKLEQGRWKLEQDTAVSDTAIYCRRCTHVSATTIVADGMQHKFHSIYWPDFSHGNKCWYLLNE